MLSKSTLINGMRQQDSFTENGALTNSTSLNACVDLFFLAGASRNLSEGVINQKIATAYAEDPYLTVKIIFWAGDVRGGAGERRFFRTALKWLDKNANNHLVTNIVAGNVEFYNRWDSMFELENSLDTVLVRVEEGLSEGDALLAKWLPRRGQYNGFANKFMRHMGWSPKQYRKTIVGLSNTVEQKMCDKRWSDINYSHVPSMAMNKYRKAFYRNDGTRFTQFIEDVKKGEAKINAGAIFPHNLYDALHRGDQADAVDVQWDALPNYMEGNSMKILPVCDISGSMAMGTGLPMSISVSLGIYISQRNTGIFENAFVSFSDRPVVQYTKGTFSQRVQQFERSQVGYSTNLQAVFDLLLNTALREKIPANEMPDVILLISDMAFNVACPRNDKTNFQVIEEKYKQAGYERPVIVFWNVNARDSEGGKNLPVKYDENGTALVSGASPSILKGILGGTIFNPEAIMRQVVDSERYDRVC